MDFSVPVINLISALYVIVMLAGLVQTPAESISTTRPFRYCLLLTLLGLAAETAAYLADGVKDLTALLYISTVAGILLVDCVVFFYVIYLKGLLPNRSAARYKWLITFLTALSVLSFVVNLTVIVTGRMFTITDGIFAAGPFYGYRTGISGIIFAFVVYLYMSKYRTFGLKSRWLTFLFVIIPAAATIGVILFGSEIRFGSFSVIAICLFVIYVVIQSKLVIGMDVHAQLLSEISVSDALTGLKNRRGYDEMIDSLLPEEKVGVVFCDANGLKTVNDNESHAAGDEFLKKISNILTDAFPDGEVYRISGDEFVCVLRDESEERFTIRMNTFRKTVLDTGRIIAFGYAQGRGAQFLQVVKEAEKLMYSDKSDFYLKTGKDRRS